MIMMRAIAVFLALAFTFDKSMADTAEGLVERIDACIGLVGAPGEHPEYCMGIYAEPCIDVSQNQTTQGMIHCIAIETAAWDEILNREYLAVISKLTPEQSASLIDAQRKWIAFRDADCAFPRVLIDGTMAGPWSADCVMQHTARRAVELRGVLDFLEY